MLKVVIFDVDGTLVDSVDVHAQAWVDAFAEFGHDITFEAVRNQIGRGGDQLMPVFLDPQEKTARGSTPAGVKFSNRPIFSESQIEPGGVVVVGDTPYDAEAAAKVGLRTIGLLCGGFLRDPGCIAIYQSPADLLAQHYRSPLAPG